MMEYKDYEKMSDAIDKAQESIIPFPIVDGDTLTVVGDANATELNKHDFKMRFRVPVEQEDGTRQYTRLEKEFKDVYITPRDDNRIMLMIAQILPYFRKLDADGGIEKLSDEEKLAVYEQFDDEVFDSMYNVVSAVLKVDRALKDFMHPMDVVKAAIRIMDEFPEAVNQADTFFK